MVQLTFNIQNLKTNSPDSYLTNKVLSDNKMGFYAFIGITADFQFWVDNICVLKEPYWNIGELAMQLNRWLNMGFNTEFQYACMDAEEKGLFSFKKAGNAFLFYSEWANENLQALIETTTLTDFIRKFSLSVEAVVSQQLGFDASFFLG